MSTWKRTPATLLHPNKNYDVRREFNTKRKPHLKCALVNAILLWSCYSPYIDGGELNSYLCVIKQKFLLKREVEDVFGKIIKFLKRTRECRVLYCLSFVCIYLKLINDQFLLNLITAMQVTRWKFNDVTPVNSKRS